MLLSFIDTVFINLFWLSEWCLCLKIFGNSNIQVAKYGNSRKVVMISRIFFWGSISQISLWECIIYNSFESTKWGPDYITKIIYQKRKSFFKVLPATSKNSINLLNIFCKNKVKKIKSLILMTTKSYTCCYTCLQTHARHTQWVTTHRKGRQNKVNTALCLFKKLFWRLEY